VDATVVVGVELGDGAGVKVGIRIGVGLAV
jgi:hypothetical protein